MKLILIGLVIIAAGFAAGIAIGHATFETGKKVGLQLGLKQAAQACIAERGFTYSKQRYSCNLVYVSAFGGEQ